MLNRDPYRLLIIEDGADDRLVYRFMLERQAVRNSVVTVVASGEEGLAALRSERFDCMLLDHSLPDMTGLELLDMAADADGGLPCATVIVTGNDDERIAAEARSRGVHACMLKEAVDEASLFRSIDAAIGAWQAQSGRAEASQQDTEVGPTTIAAAKRALAASFGVTPDRVEIVIRG